MRPIAKGLSALALVATIVPAVLYFTRTIDLDQTKLATNAATLLWFVATPLWMRRTSRDAEATDRSTSS